MSKARKATLEVQGTEITVMSHPAGDFISLTDMLKAKDGDFFISDWLRNRNTVEFLGIWERIHNPDFNYGEFATIKSQAGLNSYKISVKDWVAKTHAIGLRATAGRYGGTYAHQDIAFEFGMWISPEFKIYLIKEFQRLNQMQVLQHRPRSWCRSSTELDLFDKLALHSCDAQSRNSFRGPSRDCNSRSMTRGDSGWMPATTSD